VGHVGEELGLVVARGLEFLALRLELAEEADVLDGDHGLVGESGYQLDLLASKGPYLGPLDREDTDDHGLSEHGDGQDRRVRFLCRLLTGPLVLGVCDGIGDVHHPAVENGPSRRGLPIQAHRVLLGELSERRGRPARDHHAVEVPILPIDQTRVGAA
jgi:hypothetical protein